MWGGVHSARAKALVPGAIFTARSDCLSTNLLVKTIHSTVELQLSALYLVLGIPSSQICKSRGEGHALGGAKVVTPFSVHPLRS